MVTSWFPELNIRTREQLLRDGLPRREPPSKPGRAQRPQGQAPQTQPGAQQRGEERDESPGLTRRGLAAMLEGREIRRVARDRYAIGPVDPLVRDTLERGRRLTCVSALEHYGFWVPPFDGIHVAELRRGASASGIDEVGPVLVRDGPPLLDERGEPVPPVPLAIVHHDPPLRSWPDDRALTPILVALDHALRCQGSEIGAVLLESGLNLGLISADDAWELRGRQGAKTARDLRELYTCVQSGTETVVRRFLRSRRIAVRPQAWIADVGRVDLLVGDRMIIECDSVEHHTGEDSYASDRRRDLAARKAGYVTVRLTYTQVMGEREWPRTQAALLEMIRSGDHRRPRRQVA